MVQSLTAEALEFRLELDSVLTGFLEDRSRHLRLLAPEAAPAISAVRRLVEAGGKRVRPWFVEWGYRAAGGRPDARLARAAAAVELVHSFALIQDDVMDRSALRRGNPAAHLALAGEAGEHFGVCAAMLASDLAFTWADQLLVESGFAPDRVLAALRVFTTLREEVTAGQYLDLAAGVGLLPGAPAALRVNLLKTARYTVLRPIQVGLTLASAPSALIEGVAAFAEPAGVAFQLRDDLLGAFGDAALTGKPDGDDLLQRKPTWLLATASGHFGPAGTTLRRMLARSDLDESDLGAMREAISATGAVVATEAMIADLRRSAEVALAALPLSPVERERMAGMLVALVDRDT